MEVPGRERGIVPSFRRKPESRGSRARCRCHPDIAAFGEPDCLNHDSLDYGMTLMKKKKDKEYRDNPQIK